VKVYPVVVNEAGDELFPTGSVAVRFATTPTDADLARFVAEHKLQIRARNSYVPRQVAFDAVSATRFLPDVLSELEQDDTVERVWPETISQYRRG
jgi:hypothetical protein